MSTEDRLTVLEKVLSTLIDKTSREAELVSRITTLEARIEKLCAHVEELKAGCDAPQKFSMSGSASVSLFEKMFPGAANSKKACADAAAFSGVTTMDGVGGEEVFYDGTSYMADDQNSSASTTRRARIISKK